MEVHLAPELLATVDKLVIETGCPPEKLIEDALAGYVPELARTREMLDSRYDVLKSGRVKLIDGEAFFESLPEFLSCSMSDVIREYRTDERSTAWLSQRVIATCSAVLPQPGALLASARIGMLYELIQG